MEKHEHYAKAEEALKKAEGLLEDHIRTGDNNKRLAAVEYINLARAHTELAKGNVVNGRR